MAEMIGFKVVGIIEGGEELELVDSRQIAGVFSAEEVEPKSDMDRFRKALSAVAPVAYCKLKIAGHS